MRILKLAYSMGVCSLIIGCAIFPVSGGKQLRGVDKLEWDPLQEPLAGLPGNFNLSNLYCEFDSPATDDYSSTSRGNLDMFKNSISGQQSNDPVMSKIYLNIPENPSILRCKQSFLTKRHQDLMDGLERGKPYFRMIERKLLQRGLPQEIIWIPLIESGFRLSARSRNHAKGMWQFMPIMAREFGLQVDSWIDERCHPEHSTDAALDILEYMKERTGNWLLAFAAYNSGEGRVRKAVRAVGSHDYWTLAERKVLPSQTRFYVSAILAIDKIVREDKILWKVFESAESEAYDIVKVDRQVNVRIIANCAGVEVKDIFSMNPWLKRSWTPPDSLGYEVRLPSGTAVNYLRRIGDIPFREYTKLEQHTVKSGETLSRIAQLYQSTVDEIMIINGLRGTVILEGSVLMVPRGINIR